MHIHKTNEPIAKPLYAHSWLLHMQQATNGHGGITLTALGAPGWI